MSAVVIYESMYGNTHVIANAIAEGLKSLGDVRTASTDEVSIDEVVAADLLVVGGPTHIHGMTSKRSREDAATRAEEDPETTLDEAAASEGLREWFDELPKMRGTSGAAFDTRAHGPAFVTGSASKGIAKRLHRHGLYELLAPESFLVDETTGPLTTGEVERARAWGEALAAEMRRRA